MHTFSNFFAIFDYETIAFCDLRVYILMILYKISKILTPITRVSDPHHFNADPDSDPAYHFNAGPDPAFHFYAYHFQDPDPAPHKGEVNLRLPLAYKPSRPPF